MVERQPAQFFLGPRLWFYSYHVVCGWPLGIVGWPLLEGFA